MTEYKETTVKLYDNDLEQASNSYLMATVSLIAGMPLPVVNLIASIIYLLNRTKSSYFVRWHCMQSVIAQAVMIPFNSIAVAWTLKILSNDWGFLGNHQADDEIFFENFYTASQYYWPFIACVIIFNFAEFISVLITASEVRKGKNVRLPIIAGLTDALTSKENRDPYRI